MLKVDEIFRSIQGEGRMTGVPMTFVRLFGCNLSCNFCLGPKSKVKTVYGMVSIEDLSVGDKIIGWDGTQPTWTTVQWVGSREVDSVLRLEFEGVDARKVLFATEEHPFFVVGNGWVGAKDLVVGDVLLHIEPGAVIALQKRANNPMRNPCVAAKKVANTDWEAVGRKISAARSTPEALEKHREALRRQSPEHKQRLREAASARMQAHNPMHDPDVVERMVETSRQRGIHQISSLRMKKLWDDPDFCAQQTRRMSQQNPMFDPEVVRRAAETRGKLGERSGQEIWLEKLVSEYGLPLEFVGDFRLPIGNSEYGYRFPDFRVIGRQKVVETYSPTLRYSGELRGDGYERSTRSHYSRFGWRVHFVVCDYVKIGSVKEQEIVGGLAEFVHNGLVLKSVREVGGKYIASALHSRRVWNVRCEPYPNFFVGPGVLSHNCDTPQDGYAEMRIKDIVRQVQDEWVCITGGEPLIHEELPALIDALRERLIRVAIETNGMGPLPKGLDWVCVSPKSVWPGPFVLGRADEIKLLVGSGFYDPEEIVTHSSYSQYKLWFSLQPVWDDNYKANLQRAIELCQKHQVRLSVQMHKLIGVE